MKKLNRDPKKIEELLTRGVAEVINCDHLKKRLLAGEKLRVKLGIDPTSPNLHIGRAVALLKLRDFQDLGCQVVFIVGDFTGQIGDTSDKDSERPMLSKTLVEKNMGTYLDQAYKILDKDKTKIEIVRNSKWLSKLTLDKLGAMATWFSLAEFIARENIKNRLHDGKRISLREILYPLMQGYDSVRVVADVEIGGTDQRFNMLAGRELQRHPLDILRNDDYKEITKRTKKKLSEIIDKKDNPQDILMVNLIEGTDGRKMSSSWGNTINLIDVPNEMFGKIMSIPDELIVKYFIHCTRVSMEIVKKTERGMKSGALNPRDTKMLLAFEIVKIYHGEKEAKKAQEYFVKTIQKKEIPNEVAPSPAPPEGILFIELIVKDGLASSKSDARRKMEQGGVTLDGEKIYDHNFTIAEEHYGKKYKIGREYREIVPG